MSRSAKIAEKLEQLEGRLSEVRSNLAQAENRLEELHDEQGKAIARGDGKKVVEELKSRIREAADEVEGYRRAIPLLEEAIAGTEQDLDEAKRVEAEARASKKVDEGLEAVEALHGRLTEVIENELLPLADRAQRATSDAWAAEREAARLADRRPPSTTRVVQDGWWSHEGLQQLIEAFPVYLAGGSKAYREQQKAEAQTEAAKA